MSNPRYAADFDRACISTAFQRLGYTRVPAPCQPGGSAAAFDVYWASVFNIASLYRGEVRISNSQLLNHFPEHIQLTRKDLMASNVKRWLREHRSEASVIPDTFMLPSQLSAWREAFRATPGSTWIVKPAGGSQGRGIFLVTKRSQLNRWVKNEGATGRNWLVSRYIDNPLLISGKKFDLRIYVLVTSFHPLIAYIHEDGFCRFCSTNYTPPRMAVDNKEALLAHLTNVSLQKYADSYDPSHGGKWPMNQFMFYMSSTYGEAAGRTLWASMRGVIITMLQAAAPKMGVERRAFELYGFDLMIDSNLRPWLIEVNASPSLSASTDADRIMKTRVITDTLKIVTASSTVELGGFEVLTEPGEDAETLPAARTAPARRVWR